MTAEFPPVVFTADGDKDRISRAHKAGRLTQLGTGVYSPDVHRSPEQIVREHLWTIVARRFPGAVIGDRSARTNGLPSEGFLFVIHPRRTDLRLAGVTVVPRQGPSAMPGDFSLPGGLWLAGPARGLLDNLVPTRPASGRPARTLTRTEVELWIDEILSGRGEDALNAIRDHARGLAPFLGRQQELDLLDKLVGASMNTHPTGILQTPQLIAHSQGRPYDRRRTDAFARLADYLDGRAPDSVPALPVDAPRRTLLPFYEAYFSNYIEGTEFTLEEAAAIVFDDVVPAQRPEDAHDVLGTYELTSSDEVMRDRPTSADELVEVLRRRHAILMAGRPAMSPGTFKTQANRAGETYFVAPELVEGTLKQAFDIGAGLISPFARAVYMMFVVSEVHPFADGNGRIARIMMNAELASAGEVRIVVPTVYRLNYLSALRGATHNENYPGLLAALAFARRWTARVDFTDRERAEADLVRTNALRDAHTAEEAGVRLTLP
ncbi:Fic family protein [Mumia sp. Pv 4-285]|uniref:Fic family protein n=1 Tax=Mumia qirimensis TaxID=3234852 RepID=UPI00351D35D8